jgi:hypothetical protein
MSLQLAVAEEEAITLAVAVQVEQLHMESTQ